MMSILSPHFFKIDNLLNIGQHSAIIGVVATGMTLVLLSGGIDISVGGITALTTMIISTTIPKEGGVFTTILIGLGVGAVCGLINGIVITKAKILPLIATLATLSVFRGFAYLWTNGVSVAIVNPGFAVLGRGYFLSIPVSIYIMVFVFLLVGLVLKYTPFGRMIYSVGGNAQASRLAGINVGTIRLMIYVLCGILAGLGGVLTASQTGAGIANTNEGLEMEAIAAAILGGTSLHGGKGKIIGTVIGVLILVTLNNGMNL
jgi:Ribose/xylose/arabinose/galactoside ABC-type transport systems, permease components